MPPTILDTAPGHVHNGAHGKVRWLRLRARPSKRGRVVYMKIYWSLKSIPELAELTPAERTVVWHAVKGRAWSHWQTWLGATLAITFALALGLGVLVLIQSLGITIPGLSPRTAILARYFLAGFFCGGLVVGVASYLIGLVIASQLRPHLRDYLNDGGISPEDLET